mmetsp:Transcript_17357/g.46857  ORF Transcript_17357/g.46857 Transcript_17357/m.46857 type:complete len:241 (+) Transcript_17357:454-1176(+)
MESFMPWSWRYATRSAIVVKTSPCSLANSLSSGMRAIVRPSADTTSHRAPHGFNPASSMKSTVASVCPSRVTVPLSRARSGKICPGLLKALGPRAGSASWVNEFARSPAEIPVVVPSLASTETVKAVPLGSSFLLTMGGSWSSSMRFPGMDAQITPEVWRTMKAMVASVACSAAIIRSPSFSRSSSSVTRMSSPRRRACTASTTVCSPRPRLPVDVVIPLGADSAGTLPAWAASTNPSSR